MQEKGKGELIPKSPSCIRAHTKLISINYFLISEWSRFIKITTTKRQAAGNLLSEMTGRTTKRNNRAANRKGKKGDERTTDVALCTLLAQLPTLHAFHSQQSFEKVYIYIS